MLTILAIRHGETDENKLRILQGQSRGTLAESGRYQALKLGIHLKEESFDNIFLSDLQRTKDTWQWMGLSNSVIYEERLRERAFGKYEGESRDKIMHAGFDETEIEPKGVFFRRVTAFVDDRISYYMSDIHEESRRELWLTHGGTLRIILQYLCNRFQLDLPKTRFDNTGVTQYCIQDGKLIIEKLNDTQHLS